MVTWCYHYGCEMGASNEQCNMNGICAMTMIIKAASKTTQNMGATKRHLTHVNPYLHAHTVSTLI